METVQGNLTLLGNSTINMKHGVTTYTLIEIGGRLLTEQRISNALKNFLQRALDQSGETTLFLDGKRIVAVRLPDGKLYYSMQATKHYIWGYLLGVLMLPVFGAGFVLFALVGYAQFKHKAVEKLFLHKGIAVTE